MVGSGCSEDDDDDLVPEAITSLVPRTEPVSDDEDVERVVGSGSRVFALPSPSPPADRGESVAARAARVRTHKTLSAYLITSMSLLLSLNPHGYQHCQRSVRMNA